jgi:hypothetical protein
VIGSGTQGCLIGEKSDGKCYGYTRDHADDLLWWRNNHGTCQSTQPPLFHIYTCQILCILRSSRLQLERKERLGISSGDDKVTH